MKRELAKIEGAGGARAATVGASGQQGMDNLRLLRDLRYYETIYEMLGKQYELAKLDESKDPSIIQVLEKAIEPDVKSGPKRRPIVMFAALAAALVALLWAFAKEALDRARGNPAQSRRLRARCGRSHVDRHGGPPVRRSVPPCRRRKPRTAA